MSTSEGYISHWLGFWNSLSDTSMARWSRAVHDARRRRYDTAALMSDWVCAIDDATNAWCAAVAGPRPAELVLFDILQTTQTDGRAFPIFKPSCPNGNLEVIWLGPVGPVGNAGHALQPKHVQVYWVGTTSLEVRLTDLGNPSPTASGRPKAASPLRTGLYRFLVNAQQKLLLDVYVRVSQPPKESTPDANGPGRPQVRARAAAAKARPRPARKPGSRRRA